MNISKRLGVAFLWHMHQPFYKDPLTGKYQMPWVRLHGVKDYYPMAALVEDFAPVRVTFNLVPSLVEQINDYVHNETKDTFLDLTAVKATALTFEQKVAILNNFFKVNFKQFIEPNKRYESLLLKKGVKTLAGSALKKVVKSFSSQDFLDLQALFNLAWFHSINIEEDVNLKELVAKKEGYTEEDKEYIIACQKKIMSRIIPLYRKLQDEGRIEITTTPFYHPILPLICDTNDARPSLPGSPLPKRFSHPEDAEWHVTEAIKYHTEQFGVPPAGMWPSEGSVSDKALDVLIRSGIKWVATDEDILFRSLSLYDKKYKGVTQFDRRIIYRPYRYENASGHITMIFRDKNLSDIISFNYNAWDQDEAAWDLINHCNNIESSLRRDTDRGLLTIVMDGENAWEYYKDNGRLFFETLYGNIDKEENIGTTTISDFLSLESPKRSISNVFPGSWINHNFEIWIGQEQDNISWSYLDRVRKDLVRFTRQAQKKGIKADDAKIRQAWRELYIAEGSDWNWWYGGKAHVGNENPFDRLYRTHLKNIYTLMGKEIPDFLKISIA
ncbi:MAG: glycoside hydrolase family 57 protein [Candidatus Omnitrophica bacterium]|nr:glycoside hydrolase family 57 protein [Candidatus Omnitrophota bacterium]MCM8790725.1 glycoside hydrolase family 57 protein [Candidatus Omnitrophota bacterium]